MMKPITPSILLLCFAGLASHGAFAATIQSDANIDASYPYPGEDLLVTDGPSGPSTVRILEGGRVAGIRLRQNSVIELDGGIISRPSNVQDSAQLVIRSGSIGCFEIGCAFADVAALVRFEDNSSLYVSGGAIEMLPLQLRDSSTATFVGSDFELTAMSGDSYNLSGTLLDGTSLSAFLQIEGDPGSKVFLVEVPEPQSVVLFCSGLLGLFGPAYQFRLKRAGTRELLHTPQ